ncbi:hypothetical protein ACF0H5_010268 [Mactra antiquata]
MDSEHIPKSLPLLKIKASNNYDVGYQIGQRFKQAFSLMNESPTGLTLKNFYNSENGKAIFDEYVTKTTEAFPDIVDEIRGMADGSEMSFDQLFLNSILSEVTLTTISKKEKEIAGCTDILVNTDQCKLVGHNEDWDSHVSGHAFLIDVEVDKDERKIADDIDESNIRETLCKRDERFVGFVFPGELVGSTFAMNKHFAFTINTLVPRRFNQGSVILFVLLRALLKCETISECVEVMKCEPYGCSYGININVASLNTSDMWSIEVYPDQDKTVVDLLHIPKQAHDDDSLQYVHTNHYKHIDDVDEMEGLEGSKAREDVASSVQTPSSIEDVRKVLGDRSSDVQPIYRLPTETKNVLTAATAVFDLNEKTLVIYHGNPANEDTPNTVVPFIQ